MITLEPKPSLKDSIACFEKKSAVPYSFGQSLVFLSSGKASLALLLDYFRESSHLINKNASFFVPYWIGSPVYQEIAGKVIPCPGSNHPCDLYLMYHQYGYPQDVYSYRDWMKNPDAVIVEDLAHRIEGPLLSVNSENPNYSICSFSKFTFCNMLGGILTTDQIFLEWLESKKLKASVLMNLYKLLDELNIRRKNFRLNDPLIDFRKIYFSQFSSYPAPLDSSVSLFKSKISQEISARKKNYLRIKEVLDKYDIFPNSKFDCDAPYAIPLRLSLNKIESIQNKISSLGVRVENNYFDYNHNNLNPNFQKSLILPCHSQLSEDQFEKIGQIVKQTI